MNHSLGDPKTLLILVLVALSAIGILFYTFFRPSADPEQAERKRRLHLNQIGRIAEGQVVELLLHPAEETPAPKGLFASKARPIAGRSRHIVSYTYSISGVTYQTGQDITGLESQVRLERLVAGQPASIKYDPSNPVDSILVADDWSGLR